MEVPFIDLKIQYRNHRAEFDRAFSEVCENSSYILGPQLKKFEQDFATWLETGHTVGVGTGTDALILAFKALNLKAGDEVIMPAHTFVATAIGILEAGLKPVLVDIDPKTYLMDPTQLEKLVTPRTKAICPVHLYGRACDMDVITAFAKKHSLSLVEDAAQAHGARWKGKVVGTFGQFGCFSFYPGKNLGAYGDGGAISTNDETLARQIRKLRNYGSEIKYEHPERGTNSRLDSVQAGVLSVKLKHLSEWNKNRQRLAAQYNELLSPLERSGKITLPELPNREEHVWHLYVIQTDDRDKVMQELGKRGVQSGIHYPNPFYLQGGYRELNYKEGAFPVTERIAKRIVSLPMFPEMTDEQVAYVAKSLQEILA